MSIFDKGRFSPGFAGQTSVFEKYGLASRKKKQKRPETMQEWGSYVDGLSRYERDQQYPGMHKDLIPSYEMITGGDPNWGAAAGTGMPGASNVAEQASGSQPNGQYLWPFGDKGDEDGGAEGNDQQCEQLRQEIESLAYKVTAYEDAIVRAHEAIGDLQEESDEHDEWREENWELIEQIIELYFPLMDIGFFMELAEETRMASVGAGWFSRSIATLFRFLGTAYALSVALLEIARVMDMIIPDRRHDEIWNEVKRVRTDIDEFEDKALGFEKEVSDLEDWGYSLGCDREGQEEPGNS